MTATQAPTPGPLSGDDELIERGLRSIRTYDAVRSLRDALTATTARLTGYDWNADPDAITKQQGDAFAAADKVFADLDAAVAAHPEIDLPECEACNGTGKIEEPARPEGANQHSACVRSCDECDGCGFAPDERLAPTAPVEASGSERVVSDDLLIRGLNLMADHFKIENPLQRDFNVRGWPNMPASTSEAFSECAKVAAERLAALRPQPSGETREDRLSAALIAMVEHFERVDAGPEDKAAIQAACEVWAGVKRDKALSTTPARAEAQNEDEDTACTDCGDTGLTHQTERRCSCQEAEAQDEGAAGEPVAETAGEAEQTALNIICDPGIITGLHTAAEARDWIEKSVRAALRSKKKPTSEEVDARRRLINLIEQWDGESEYDAEDIASLADDILHEFNGAPVTDCKTCAGNGEIVTDWNRYLGAPQSGDQGHEGTAACPDCSGIGKVDVARAEAQDEGAIKAAYKRGWNDRESDIIERAERIAPMNTPAQDEGAAGEIGAAIQRVEAVSLGGDVLDVYGADSFAHPTHTFRGDLRALLARARPSPTPAADADRVRIAAEALEPFARRADYWEQINGKGGSDRAETAHAIGDFKKARQAFAALKSTAAKEGGE